MPRTRSGGGRLPNGIGGRRSLILLSFALAYFFSNFFRSANAVIAGDLSRQMSLSAQQLGLMTSLFYAVFALVQLPLGGALDRWGPRWVTSSLMLSAVVGSLVFSRAVSFGGLALGRALIGAGMAGVLMGTYTAFSRWFSARRFATASSIVVAVGALGALATGAPLAWFDQKYGWRAIFFWGAVGVLVSAVFIVVFVRDRPPTDQPSPRRASDPAGSYRDIFRDRRFYRIAVLNFMVVGTFLAMQGLWFGPFLFDALGLDKVEAGSLITLAAVGGLAGYLTCGWLADHYGRHRVAVFGISVFLLAQLGLVATGVTQSLGLAYLAYLLFGLGGAYNIVLMAHVRELFPLAVTGRAVSAVNMFGIGGTAVLQWGMGMIIGAFGRDAGGHYPAEAYVVTFALTGLGGLAALLWYVRLKPSEKHTSAETELPPL
jgi:MFS family permease